MLGVMKSNKLHIVLLAFTEMAEHKSSIFGKFWWHFFVIL